MIDELQRHMRARRIGASDAAAVCGRDPYRSPLDVWCQLTGRLRPRTGTNPAMDVGTYMEAGILGWAEAQLGVPISRDLSYVHPNGIAVANLDGLALSASPPRLVEAKSSGILGKPKTFEEWGDPNSDEIPTHVLLQVHHQFAVLAAQSDLPPITVAYVPTLLVWRGFVGFVVPRDADLMAAVFDQEARFWRDYVATNRQPPDELPADETLQRWLREPKSSTTIDGTLVLEWQAAQERAKAATADADTAKRLVLAALGDAEEGVSDVGVIHYLEQTRKSYTTKDTTFRTVRFVPAPRSAA